MSAAEGTAPAHSLATVEWQHRRVPAHETARTASNDAGDARSKILQGAIRSIARHGLERSSIASVAREAGMSRQTLYAYYANRDDLLRDAITRAANDLMERVGQRVLTATNATDFLVELTLGVVEGVRSSPAISAMLYSLDTAQGRELAMSPAVRSIVAESLAPLTALAPHTAERLDEIAETCLRFTLSLLTYPSERTEAGLRTYLSATLPGLVGLTNP